MADTLLAGLGFKVPSRHAILKSVAAPPRQKRQRSEDLLYNEADSVDLEIQDDPHIGRIFWSDISKAAKYHLPDEYKKTIRQWMRSKDQINMDGGSNVAKQNFRELMDDLGFSNPSVFKPLRDLCELKAMEFVRNEGSKFVKNGQVKVNLDGTRVWAMYTVDWLKEDWIGDTSDPCISRTRNRRKKPIEGNPSPALLQGTGMSASDFVQCFDISVSLWSTMDMQYILNHILSVVTTKIPDQAIKAVPDLLKWLETGKDSTHDNNQNNTVHQSPQGRASTQYGSGNGKSKTVRGIGLGQSPRDAEFANIDSIDQECSSRTDAIIPSIEDDVPSDPKHDKICQALASLTDSHDIASRAMEIYPLLTQANETQSHGTETQPVMSQTARDEADDQDIQNAIDFLGDKQLCILSANDYTPSPPLTHHRSKAARDVLVSRLSRSNQRRH